MKPKATLTTFRLYVWDNFCSDYTSGLAFAIARNETDARAQIEKILGFKINHRWGNVKTYPVTQRVAHAVAGGG